MTAFSPALHIGGAVLAVVLLCLFAFRQRTDAPKHRQPPN